ncbi:MAG: Ger(x)C family spore germination C-terminal domain-containing protein, partial [Christensenellaceae bacterium]
IILGVGIDRDGAHYRVTAELAMPENTGKAKPLTVTGKGATVGDALTDVGALTGWYPKLTFCDVILLGESATDEIGASLSYFLRNENVSDGALVAFCEGSAEDFLSEQPSTSELTSLAVKEVLSSEAEKSAVSLPVTLRELVIKSYGESRSATLPYLSRTEKGIDCTRTALLFRGKRTGLLSAEETLTYCLLSCSVRLALLAVKNDSVGYALGIRNNRTALSVSMEDGVMKAHLVFEAKALVSDSNEPSTIPNLSQPKIKNPEVLASAEEELTERIRILFAAMRQSRCDLLGIRKEFLRRYPKEGLDDSEDDLLDRCLLSVSVRLKSI